MFQRIKKLADRQGLSLNQVEEKLGYSKNTLYRLKTQLPGGKKLHEIADFFNVSTDYLLGRDDNDISKKIDEMLVQLSQKQDSLMYRGEILDDEIKELVLVSMQQAMKIVELKLKKK